jgi:tape measure domain-containing protein
MASIDNRVVEMKFDNAAFQTKIDSTIKSIEKLDASLKLAEGTQGLKNVDAAAKEVNFGGISSALDGITSKFNVFSIVGITALVNVANKAVDAGIALGKSLSLDQVITGFREYETNMRSIQTIMANTRSEGATLEQVNNALDILNQYSDQTIYNFSEMTKNIGTFTAAGVKLDTAVGSIKGIANLAAVSGSSSEQAANAMYQLSQAISTGSLKLMDWNSVVNAGMGGKVFQEALFETGKTLGTISNVPIDQTFDDWTKAGNTFRGSLEKGWITSEVLTQTLRNFTGELSKEQLLAIGYTEKQANQIVEMGGVAVEAATKVRTFTQLIDVARESVASGWSQSFRIILGDFEQATELFSTISASFSGMVGRSADARNELLTDWASFGGRKAVINGVMNAATALSQVINRLQAAFARVFPPLTAVQLTKLSWAFEDFTKNLIPSQETLRNIGNIFEGVFSILEIGFTIVREAASSFKRLFVELGKSEGSSKLLDFIKGLADDFVKLNKILVDGQIIAKVFDVITDSIIRFAKDPVGELTKLKDAVVEAFNIISTGTESLGNLPSGVVDFLLKVRDAIFSLGDVTPFFAMLYTGFERLKSLTDAFDPIIEALSTFAGYIINWFKELFGKMGDAAEPGDFSKVLDGVNLAIVASIGGLLAFLAKGVNVDLAGGLFNQVRESLDEVTGTLKAMQMDLKANALLKIAAAIGILAVSLLLLASIDSASLTKALTAVAVGLGQLMVSFSILSKISGPKSAASFTIASSGLIALSGAVLLMAFAVKTLSGLSVGDLAKGLIAITLITETLVFVAKQLSGNTSGLIRAGIGLIGVGIALNILAAAVKLFSLMDLGEMAKGLLGVTIGLTVISTALQLMPSDSFSKAAGLILVAGALNILAIAVTVFSKMSWNEMAKGFGAVALGLTIIAVAMHLMPTNMLITAAGLIVVSGALVIIALALKEIANLSWNELAKGLVAIAGALLFLTIAAHAMQGAIGGAIAMTVMSVALLLIADALSTIGNLSWSEIIKGLIGIAATFAVIAISATLIQPTIGAILSLGAALLLIGVAVGVFGLGVNALARGIKVLVDMGQQGIDWFIALLDNLLERIPILAKALAIALLEIVDIVLEALPVIVVQLGVIIGHLIDTLIELLPKFKELIIELISTIIEVVDEKGVDVLMAGYRLLTGFISGLVDNVQDLVKAVADLIIAFLNALATKIPEIVAAGLNLLKEFIRGIVDNIHVLIEGVGKVVGAFITGVADLAEDIAKAGTQLLVDFLIGITNNLIKITETVATLIATFLDELSKNLQLVIDAGFDFLTSFIQGITDKIPELGDAVWKLVNAFITEVGKNIQRIIDRGIDLAIAFINGIASGSLRFADESMQIIVQFIDDLADAIDKNAKGFRDAGFKMAGAIINGMTFGLAGKAKDGVKAMWDVGTDIIGGALNVFKIWSPSRVFRDMGENLVAGLAVGMQDTRPAEKNSERLANRTITSMQNTLSTLSDGLAVSTEFNPTITPVLDLTNVKMGAKSISDLVNVSDGISSTLTFKQAQTIANTEVPTNDTVTTQTGNTEVTFEQNIYSPTQLSTADIYRQTRNQITLAKEELSIS